MSLAIEAAQLLGRMMRREPQLLRHNAVLYTRSWYHAGASRLSMT
jgi:hypothetical protein